MRRKFVIRRTFARYGDRSIVCDYCHNRLHRSFYYEIFENDRLANIYPFHTLLCAEMYIHTVTLYNQNPDEYDIEIEPGSEDDPFQEESTE